MPSQKLQQKFNKVQSNFRKYEEIPEDWNLKTLNEIGKVSGGGTPKTKEKKYWNGKIRWAIPSDLTNLEKNFIENTERTITQLGLDESSANLFKPGTVLLSSRATVGECKINTVPMATNQGFQNIECNESFDNLFVLYSIQYNKIKLIRYAFGTTFLEINKNNVKKVKLACPEFPEQQKIALILSNVDDSIQKTNEQIEKTKDLKEGLEQFIFHKGITQEKIQKIKTKQGKSLQFPISWKLSKVKQIAKFSSGEFLPEHKQQNGKIPVFGGNGITGYHNEFLIDFKTVVIGRVGAYCGNAYLTESKSWITDNAIFVKETYKKFNIEYLFRFISRLNIRLLAEVAAQPKITQNILENINIWHPNDPTEQQKIASILSNVDSQIESLQSKKSQLQKTKRGLMQKLLTGQIRVRS